MFFAVFPESTLNSKYFEKKNMSFRDDFILKFETGKSRVT